MYQAGILHLKDVYNKDSKQFSVYAEIQVILPGNYNLFRVLPIGDIYIKALAMTY